MRQNRENQLPLAPLWPHHQLGEELRVISEILDGNPSISEMLLHDLCDTSSPDNGAPGLSGEQVVRCAVLKQLYQFSYERLAFHLSDSRSVRAASVACPTLMLRRGRYCRRISRTSRPRPGSRSGECWCDGRQKRAWSRAARFGSMPLRSRVRSTIPPTVSCFTMGWRY